MFHSITKPVAQLTARQQRIYDFLASQHSGVLSCTQPNGMPHASVIYYYIDPRTLDIKFLTKSGTQKYGNITHDNHVVLVVYDEKKQKMAQVFGRTQEITDAYGINTVAGRIYAQNLKTDQHTPLPIARLQAGTYAAFTIIPDQIHVASFSRPRAGDYEQLFESIESFDLHPTRGS